MGKWDWMSKKKRCVQIFIYIFAAVWVSEFSFLFLSNPPTLPNTHEHIKWYKIHANNNNHKKERKTFLYSIHFISSQFKLGDLPRHTIGFCWIWPGWWRYTHKNKEQESKNRKAVARLPLYLFVENKNWYTSSDSSIN